VRLLSLKKDLWLKVGRGKYHLFRRGGPGDAACGGGPPLEVVPNSQTVLVAVDTKTLLRREVCQKCRGHRPSRQDKWTAKVEYLRAHPGLWDQPPILVVKRLKEAKLVAWSTYWKDVRVAELVSEARAPGLVK
jgi:hypothetical protein